MSTYRKPEWSDPKYTPDHLHFLTFNSRALGRRGNVTVFIPKGYEQGPALPMVLLLHGVYNSHWGWVFKAGAHLRALELIERGRIPPLCLIMPEDGSWGDGTGYVNHHGVDYERWIVDDVPGCVTEHFDCLNEKSPLYIAGFSMGGLGALRLGAKYCERFQGISVHSAMTHFDQMSIFVDYDLTAYGEIPPEEQSVVHWLETNRDHLPPLRMDCGTDDKLIEINRTFHAELEAKNITHIYQEYPGAHKWPYWNEHLADTLDFFLKV